MLRSVLTVLPRLLLSSLALAVLAGCATAPAGSVAKSTARPSVTAPAATRTPTPGTSATATPRPVASPTAPATRTPTPAPTIGPRSHTVQEGESLSGIAVQYGISSAALQQANGLENPDDLRLGQELIIPAVDLPEAATADTRSAVICPANGSARQIELPAEPILLLVSGETAYCLAGGGLYTMPAADLAGEGDLAPADAMPAGWRVDDYTIQELVDAAADPESGDLFLLDKSNDVYQRTAAGEWRLTLRSGTVPGHSMDPQFLAIAAYGGAVYLLDADGAVIWRADPAEPETPPGIWRQGQELATGVDLAMGPDGTLAVLTREGRLWAYIGGAPETLLRLPSAGTAPWPAQVSALESGAWQVVDGQSRTVYTVAADGTVAEAIRLAFDGMRRLRGALFAEGRLYALAGHTLYAGDAAEGGECAAAVYDDGYYFGDVDLQTALAGVEMPFPGASLPSRPRSFPGARRLYRSGVHEGVDLYPGDVAGLSIGSPVAAIGKGTVIRLDADFAEMTPDEYAVVMARTEAEHRTPPDILDRLRGQQVWVEHGPGVESHYCHLSAVNAVLSVGDAVAAGDLLGHVGVSGTSSGVYGEASGEHLHWEIWIDGQYLGYGLSIAETMRLWEAIF